MLGLMVTSALLHNVLNALHITLHIREICVFLAPLFSSFTVIVTYLLTRELKVGLSPFVLFCLHCRRSVGLLKTTITRIIKFTNRKRIQLNWALFCRAMALVCARL